MAYNETPLLKETAVLTIDQINDMTPEQLEATNKKLAKKLLTRIAVQVAVAASISIAVAAVARKFASDDEQND